MKLLLLLTILCSQFTNAKDTHWDAGDIPEVAKNEFHQMIDVAARAILSTEVPGACLMRCFTSDISNDGSYVVTGIYDVGEGKPSDKKSLIRHSIYIRETKATSTSEFFYTTFTEKVDEKDFAVQYEYFKSKIIMARNQFKEPLPFKGEIISIPTQTAVIEGIVSDSNRDDFFIAHFGDNEARPDFHKRDLELLKFLHNTKIPNDDTKWKLCKVAITIEETKEKPPKLDDWP